MLRKFLKQALIGLGCVLLLASGLLPAVGYAEEGAPVPSFRLEAQGRVAPGQQATVVVKGSGLQDLYAYEVQLQYDTRLLEYVNVQPMLAADGQGYAVPVVPTAGKLVFSFTKIGDTAGTSGDADLMKITFKALSSGSAAINTTFVVMVNNELGSRKLVPDAANAAATIEISASETSSSGSSGGTNIGGSDTSAAVGATMSAADIRYREDGRAFVQLSAEATEIRIPPAALAGLDGEYLEITNGKLSLSLVAALLKKLQITSDSVILQWTPIEADKAEATIAGREENRVRSAVKFVGQAYNFQMGSVGADGRVRFIAALGEPIKLRMPANPGANKRLTGIYSIAEDGRLEYVGGEWDGDELSAAIDRPGVYAVLEVTTTFDDVLTAHWGYEAIAELAAKQIAYGTGAGLFSPSQSVTRAEFTALLVRGLRLGAGSGSDASFSDVSARAWYAGDIAAAFEAGVVSGNGAGSFRPNSPITRQEMVAMLMKAYAWKKGASAEAEAVSAALETKEPFRDFSETALWAAPFVRSAYQLGFVQGRTPDRFVPNGQLTRAEAALVISLLIHK